MRRQQSLGLRLKELFLNKDVQEYFALHYKTDFTIEEKKLVVEINEKDHDDRDPDYERRRQKELEILGYYFIRSNPDKPNFDEYQESLNQIKMFKMGRKNNTANNTRHEKYSIKNKTDKNWERNWNNEIILPTISDMKNTQSKIKPIKTGKEIGTMYCLGCKDYTDNIKSQKVKMINKVLQEKSNCVVC